MSKFPTHENREFFAANRELNPAIREISPLIRESQNPARLGVSIPPGNPILRRDTRGRELSPRPYQEKQPLRRHWQLENLGTERYERIGKGVGKVIGPALIRSRESLLP
jgi:hypothetical protein